MPGIDEIKARSRKALHLAMQRPCYYTDPETLLPYPCDIRVHTNWEAKGEVQGTSFRFGKVREESPAVVFLVEQMEALGIEPKRWGVVMLSALEGYRLDNDEPRYRQTKKWFVTNLSDADLARYRSPDDGIVAIGRIELPMLSGDTPEYMPSLEVSGTAFMFYLMAGDIVLPPLE